MWGKFEVMAIPLAQPHSASFPGCVGEGHSDVLSYCMVWEQGYPSRGPAAYRYEVFPDVYLLIELVFRKEIEIIWDSQSIWSQGKTLLL